MFREWLDIACKLELSVNVDRGIFERDPNHFYDDTFEERKEIKKIKIEIENSWN